MSGKTVHIAGHSTFIGPFISFVEKHFDLEDHQFFLTGGIPSTETKPTAKVNTGRTKNSPQVQDYFRLIVPMHQSSKIILHGLFNWRIVVLLFLMPWLLRKCYWVIWGGDLYAYKVGKKNWKWKAKELMRRPVIKNMRFLVTYIPGDVELARQWYGAKGTYRECLMYISNVVGPHIFYRAQEAEQDRTRINILVGNSADPTNNHIEVLEKLLPHKDKDIKIYVPLSYGDQVHAIEVIRVGSSWFGEKFVPLTSFMASDDYLEFLTSIDIAIFNHNRQQAMGNTITLLGLGKTVFMRTDVTHYEFLDNLGLSLGNIADLTLSKMAVTKSKSNARIVSSYFSEESLKKQLSSIFGG